MPDVSHYYSGDIATSSNGDLLTVDGVAFSQQMVLRRLLTNPGDYIWHPEYGAGLPSLIGQAIDVPSVQALIAAQMFLESSVVQDPAPTITVTPVANGMFVEITYTETDSQQLTSLSFNVK